MSYMLTDLKKIHTLMFKLLKSIYIFDSTNRFIYEHICILNKNSLVCIHVMLCMFFFFSFTECINSCFPS